MLNKDKGTNMKHCGTPNIVFEKFPFLFSVNNFSNQIPIMGEVYRKVSRKGKTLGKLKTNLDKILSSLKKKKPTAENSETNNISQLSSPFFFRGKNSDIFGFNPKIQSNRQQKDLNRSAFATLPYRLHQNPIDPIRPKLAQ